MVRFIIAYVLFAMSAVAINAAEAKVYANKCDSLMHELDMAIATRDRVIAKKEAKLDSIRRACSAAADDYERFRLLGELFDNFSAYNTDSAFAISKQRESVALRLGDIDRIRNSRLNTAQILSETGMYKEALEIIDTIPSAVLPDYLRPYYYHLKRTVYGHLADYAANEPMRRHYTELTDMYRDSVLSVNAPGSLSYAITSADRFNACGQYRDGLAVMEKYMSENELTDHERAICAWTLAVSFKNIGDTERLKEQLLISSISDMRAAVLEYVSLRELALLLHQEGDLDRAYKFLNIAVDDAAKSNSRQRIIELNDIYPTINTIYVGTIRNQKRLLTLLVAVITLLMLGLVVALLRMRRQMQQLNASRKALADTNGKLNALNEELKRYNSELSEANREIAENSAVKEAYIGRYMDQCMSYIEKLDTYRKHLAKLASTGKIADLKAELKTADGIEREIKNFYDSFDSTFLKLFPTFVDDFNRLLMPGEEIEPRKPGTLTTELRIFALIRLGISDSDSIAKFLRYSLSTIYNYRTKVRNKASGDRSLLEENVMKIGRTNI